MIFGFIALLLFALVPSWFRPERLQHQIRQRIQQFLLPCLVEMWTWLSVKSQSELPALTGILFVLKTGIAWRDLPSEMGCGCGVACWRRMHFWHECGVWERLQKVLLDNLNYADQIDWSRSAVDSSSVRAIKGGDKTGPNPTDRAKKGTKHHVLTDAKGTPLSAQVTAANVHDVTRLVSLVDAVPPVAGKPGRPQKKPEELYADRAF